MDTATTSRVDSRLPCIDCGKPLPPHGAGKCKACAAGGIAGCPQAPHCVRCGAGFQFDPKGPMAIFNAPCRCAS